MPVLEPPAFWPNLRASLQLFRHARPGLTDPAALPVIESHAPAATLDAGWLVDYRACVGLAASDALPPLALQLAAAPLHLTILADARFPFKALGLVHLSQQITQWRAIAADEPVQLRAFTGDARPEKRGMSFCIHTQALCRGELVWQAHTRALAPGPTLAVHRQPGAVTQAPAREGSDPSIAASTQKPTSAAPDVAPSPASEFPLQVPEDMGRRYAAIAGDLNPIHQRALLARLFGFRRAIVHGTWTLARALALADLPGSGAYSLEAAFRRPVELPSDVRVRVWTAASADHTRIEVVRTGTDALCLAVDLQQGRPG